MKITFKLGSVKVMEDMEIKDIELSTKLTMDEVMHLAKMQGDLITALLTAFAQTKVNAEETVVL